MRKKWLSGAMIVAVCSVMLIAPSCIGSFALSNKVLAWNKQLGSKFVNEVVFVCFNILPVYPIALLADSLILNSIEFWSGKNPVTANTKIVEGKDGRYIVKSDAKGYTITSEFDNSEVRFAFNEIDNSWAVVVDGQSHTFMTFVDDTHVKMATPNGESHIVELSQAGLYAYQEIATGTFFAKK